MFARFDESPAMTLRVMKETKRYGRTDRRNLKTVYPLQTKFEGGITSSFVFNSLPPRVDFCCLLITFANSLDPDQASKNLGLIWILTV